MSEKLAKRPRWLRLSKEIQSQVEKHCYSILDSEVGGMFFGDRGDNVTRVAGFVPATSANQEQISLTFSHDVWQQILTEGAHKYPGKQIVGWYHTHPNFGVFQSDQDMFIQNNFFGDKGQFGLVVDPIRGEMGWFESRSGEVKQVGLEKTESGPHAKPGRTLAESYRVGVSKSMTLMLCVASMVISSALTFSLIKSNEPVDLSKLAESQEVQISKMGVQLNLLYAQPVSEYLSVEGDDWASIALRFYGDESFAEGLFAFNEWRNPQMPGVSVEPGQLILIPIPLTGATPVESTQSASVSPETNSPASEAVTVSPSESNESGGD